MIAIVAVDEHYAIGHKGGMLFHLPDDLKYFAAQTRGKTLVMGRKTLESFPGGKPLKGRPHIVFSRNPDYHPEGVTLVRSVKELEQAIRGLPGDEVMLCGGDSLYHLLIDCCDSALVTKIEDAAKQADSFFPNLDAKDNWELANCRERQERNGLGFRFCEYVNKAVVPLNEIIAMEDKK